MTGIPARNALAAIPCPIVPTPITPTCSLVSVIDRSLSPSRPSSTASYRAIVLYPLSGNLTPTRSRPSDCHGIARRRHSTGQPLRAGGHLDDEMLRYRLLGLRADVG